ncbi:MAG TPA: choice-of-anchor Q domain-containing protein [Rudaea sp.]|jgi:CSLREA domain-containing protein
MNAVYSHSLHARVPLRAPLALALAAALGVAVMPGVAAATTYTVTSTGDAGNGTCSATCTLRDAVIAANLNPGADTITFASTLSGDTILLDIAGKGHIAITDSLTIQGPGANRLTVSGGGVASGAAGGIFYDKVYIGGNSLALSGITLADGNTASHGGALSFSSGSLTLSGVAIQNNQAQSFGGGFYMGGQTLSVIDSTISGNSSSNHGGGFAINYPTVSLVDSTISGNSANGFGGGFYGRTGSNSLTIRNSTISGNSASEGGGFLLNKSNVMLTNSIVANNTAPTGAEFFGATQTATPTNVTANFSLIEGGYSVSGTFSGANNIFGQDPKLGRLANNGGPTQTQALLPGSPAIDSGNNGTCETTDQRGQSRPYDGDKNGSAICDMGAFEVNFIDLDTIFANGFD